MLYLLLKRTKPVTRIDVSNLKYEIEKATISKFGKNVKDLLDYMSSNYSIIIDKRELLVYYVRHIVRDILLGPNSTFNCLIERSKDYWETMIEVLEGDLI